MCFMDWRIGRLIRSQFTRLLPDVNLIYSLPANLSRVGLMYRGSVSLNTVGMSDSYINAQAGSFLNDINGAGVHITLATHGDLPTRALFFNCSPADASGIVFIEFIAPESLLTLGLEQVMGQYPNASPAMRAAYPNPAKGNYGD